MKCKYLIPLLLLFCNIGLFAQNDINQLLAAGVEDAKIFSESYTAPASEAVVFGLSNGWFNTAKGKKFGEFEISIVANGSFIDDNSKSFTLNTDDYNYLRFQDPSQQTGNVATVFGENNPDVVMVIDFENELGISEQAEITLPQGLGSTGINILPTAYLQASVGVFKGTEVKARFLPKIETEDVNTQLIGFGIQHELTTWLPVAEKFPLHISALIGYTNLKGGYDLTDNVVVEGDNQQIKTEMDSWLFAALVSTKLPVINFYGGLGYVNGSSKTDLLGTYRVQTGILSNQTIKDPFSISKDVSGVKATLGTKLKLSFFRINVDYSFQKYNNLSVAFNFGV